MFQDYLVTEYSDDINDITIERIKKTEKPVVIFGCGGAGRKIANRIIDAKLEIEVFCEGIKYWSEGKIFMNRPVINIEMLPKLYDKAALIIAATGQEVFDSIEILRKNNNYDIYGYVDLNQLYKMDVDWVLEHKEELDKTFGMLNDDVSRLTFLSFIGARANCIAREETVDLLSLWTSRQYFNELYPKDRFDEHILIDCGAWIGDSAENFIEFLKNDQKTITVRAFEMEKDNYSELKHVAEKYSNIICYHCGVGDKHEVVYFEKKSDASVIVDHKTDNSVEILPVDDILKGDNARATFVKMDLEGYERYALKGMTKLIKNNLPMLAICVYHKIDDLIVIPDIIRSMEEESSLKNVHYNYYLRHHSHNASELVFYAVPNCV